MKRVRLITTDKHNGKEAISRTPLRNRYYFEGAWHEIKLPIKSEPDMYGIKRHVMPSIIRDAQIIEVTEAVFAEMEEEFDIMNLIKTVEKDSEKCMHQATIQRQLCQLRQYGKLNYEVVDEQRGLYRKLPVVSKTCAEQVKMEFKPDWKNRFVEFLKKEGAYEDYMRLFNEIQKESFDDFIPMLINTKQVRSFVSGCISWPMKSIEHWSKLDKKWKAIYNGKN